MATEYTKVKLADGREVEFAGKRKMMKEVIVTDDGKVGVRFDFVNGDTRTYWVPDQHRAYSAGHGYAQKLGDETAGLKDEHGNPAEVEDMVLAVEELHERLAASDSWTAVRTGEGLAGASVLIRALVEFSGKSVDEIKAFLKDKKQAEKIALRQNPKIKPIVDRLETERASKAAKVDTEALLSGLA